MGSAKIKVGRAERKNCIMGFRGTNEASEPCAFGPHRCKPCDTMTTPIPLDALCTRFDAALSQWNTSRNTPQLEPTWRAFAAFARENVDCDDESLFFEAGISPSQRDRFYVHFTRTVYAREVVAGHVFAMIINCDFLFALSSELKTFTNAGEWAVEADELDQHPDERARFFEEIAAETTLWSALQSATQLSGDVYVGEG